MSTPFVENWVQYNQLEKLYGYLPGLAAALPAVLGLDADAYAALLARFDADARNAAAELAADPEVAAHVDALPFRPGHTVLAVGDSIVADRRSWVEMLRHLLDLRRPRHGVRVVNAGLSAHTTAMILRRWPVTLAAAPDWILCQLGANDVTRVGPDPRKSQVGLEESVANLREMRRIAETLLDDVAWVWLTPPPVDEGRAATAPAFQQGRTQWRNADIASLTVGITRLGGPVVDLTSVFGMPAAPDLQGPDGVHPSIAGQGAITRALVRRLADPRRGSPPARVIGAC